MSIKMGEKNQTMEWRWWDHDDQDNEYKKKKKKKVMIVELENVNINEDLMLEIILHLPPISVVKFKCVCKRWYSLISNSDFLRSHSSLRFQRHATNWLVHSCILPSSPMHRHFEFVCPPQDKNQPPLLKPPFLKQIHNPSLSVLFPQNHSHCYLKDSCNGLLLLLCYTENDKAHHSYKTYYIFNLITKHYFKLPNTDPIPSIREKEFEETINIVFDPSISLSYKVIRWLKNESGTRFDMYCQLYSSQTKSWRLLNTSIVNNVYFEFGSRPTLLDGVLYWSYSCTPLDVSYCFGVEKESVSPLPLPPKPIGCHFRQCLYFGECGGRLRLIEKFDDDMELYPLTLPCSFDIMEMEEHRQDGCSPWILKYHVNIGYPPPPPPNELIPEFEFIHCYKVKNKRGGEEEAMLLNINGRRIVFFNLTSNTFGKELTIPNSWCQPDFRKFFPFTPTLFPLC